MRDLDPTSSATHYDFTKPYESEADKSARYTQVFERDLFPYENTDLLVERLGSSNRLLRRAPELHDQMRTALSADDDESLIGLADDIDIARQLYAPENERPINTVFSYITMLEAIRKQGHSLGQTGGRVNALVSLLTKRFADAFHEDELPDATDSLHYLKNRTEELHKETGYGPMASINIEVLSLASATFKRLQAYQYIDMFAADAGETITEEEVRRDTQQIAELFTDIRATQNYGIKMGYVEDSRGGTLIFSSPIDPNEAFAHVDLSHPLMLQDNSVADITHSRRKRHSRIKMKVSQPVKGLSIVSGVEGLDPLISMSLGKDGELYTDRDCRTSLADIARAKGKYAAYRNMQATIIAHYFDITHSLDEVQQVRQMITELSTEARTLSDSPMESIGRLVIPRTRFRSTEHTPTTPPTQEDRPLRSVRQHDVVWHIRELPAGWHASPNACELAKKLGVVLQPHETIVKEHKRGSRLLGEVTAHHLIQRSDEDTLEE